MKKLLALLLILALVPAAAQADLPDISGLSYDELVQLKDQINLAMWISKEWQEVEIPIGVWEVGKDIPAAHWTISPRDVDYGGIHYCEKLDDTGKSTDLNFQFYSTSIIHEEHRFADQGIHQADIEMKSGWYFINDIPVIFTPYTGKPSLGFK